MARYETQFTLKFGTLIGRMLRCCKAETAHKLAGWALQAGWLHLLPPPRGLDPATRPEVQIPGLGQLAHPVGLAAGFDKDAKFPTALGSLGFSFMEIGTVTPLAQSGQQLPRIFRYPSSRSLINRMGFPSVGAELVKQRLKKLQLFPHWGPWGVNIGKNKESTPAYALEDYVRGIETFSPLAPFLVINLSSPNTPGLRALAEPEFLEALIARVQPHKHKIWLKFDPDMPKGPFQSLVEAAKKLQFTGLVLTNTHRVEMPEHGGLSGSPLASLALARLEWAWEVHQGQLGMIASGGIMSGLDVYERITRGAHAVEIYTALVYRGPWAVYEILYELEQEMKLRGTNNLDQLRGTYYAS